MRWEGVATVRHRMSDLINGAMVDLIRYFVTYPCPDLRNARAYQISGGFISHHPTASTLQAAGTGKQTQKNRR